MHPFPTTKGCESFLDGTTKGRLLTAAMKGVRLYGLDGVRIQHIGKLAGVSPGGIYTHFDSKEHLLRACFELVDRRIAAIFDHLEIDPARLAREPEAEVRRLWTPYYRWLLANPDETVFYFYYRSSPDFPEFERQRDISYFAGFLRSLAVFEELYGLREKVDADVMWLHILTATVMYAKYVLEGALPDNAQTEESLFRLEFHGINGLLNAQRKP